MNQFLLENLRKPFTQHARQAPSTHPLYGVKQPITWNGTGIPLRPAPKAPAAAVDTISGERMSERAHFDQGRSVLHGTGLMRTLAVLVCFALLVGASVPVAARTSAPAASSGDALLEEALDGQCVPPAAHNVLRAFKVNILNAPTTEEARAMVLAQTALARQALSAASFVLPYSDTVRDVDAKFAALELQLYAANTQTEIASDFAGFIEGPPTTESFDRAREEEANVTPMQLADADLDNSAVSFGNGNGGGGGCNYTTGEIIIIVLGFLLFIIPGIIFLIILC